jgi:hypothetical protein
LSLSADKPAYHKSQQVVLQKAFPKMPALASLRRFLHPLLFILGMTTPLPHSEEFPVFMSIDDWDRFLQNPYCSRDPRVGPVHRARMKSLRITRIRRYKDWRSIEYEFLVAEVSVPGLQHPRYLRIERCSEDPPAEKGSLHSFVKTMEIWPSVDKCIHNLNCTNSSIILLDLAIVAKLIYDHSEHYRLFKRQSFWYSDMIVAVLQREFPEIQLISRSKSVKRDHSQDAHLDQFDEESGTYKKIPIYSRRMSMIEEIHEGFKPYKDRLYSSVRLLIDSIHLFTYVAVDLKS